MTKVMAVSNNAIENGDGKNRRKRVSMILVSRIKKVGHRAHRPAGHQ